MMALETNADFQVFLLGFLRGGQHLADTLAVDGHRLLHKNIFALLDRLGKMDRSEARRSRQDYHVGHADGFFVGIETDELVLVLHVRLQAVIFLQPLEAAVHAILEGIGHGDELDVARRAEGLVGRSGATAAAADQRHLDRVTGLGERAALDGQAAQRCRAAGNR